MDLTPSQIARLQNLLQAGFRFITLERYGRYFGVERDGFAALLDPGGAGLRVFGQAGYLMGDGIGMLVERDTGPAFVWHGESIPATAELVDSYEHFKQELEVLLGDE